VTRGDLVPLAKPNPPPVFPHIPYTEALVAEWLRENMTETPVSGVYSSLPSTPSWPLLLVKAIGGGGIRAYWMDTPLLQVESWANSKTEGWKVIEEARRKVYRMTGQMFLAADGYPDDGVVTDVRDSIGITWLPDPVTHRDRYIWDVLLTVHPIAS
jgi:hypothetical protein